jgi:hypothetical protein
MTTRMTDVVGDPVIRGLQIGTTRSRNASEKPPVMRDDL